MYRILLVDDEPNILSALRRSLASIDVSRLDGDALKLDLVTSPEAAIERCEETEFDLVLTDYRMPSMNGVDFLIRLMDIQPHVPRVIISGYADRDAIIAAINEAQLTRFIKKPWDDDELQRAVVSILASVGRRNVAVPGMQREVRSERHLRQLETECPGITQVERAANGGIVLELEDADIG
ncbi:MAG TPA: response regulator [Rudaea sp.]|nr:response regulator [Rudaea sp.]